MLLSEARRILEQNGYLIEGLDYDLNRKGPRGSIQVIINGTTFTAKDFTKDSNWVKLQNEIKSFKKFYPEWLKMSKMSIEELSKNIIEFFNLTNVLDNNQRRIHRYLEVEGLDADLGESVDDVYNEKSKEVEKYNKEIIADETNAIVVGKDNELSWSGFEKAIVINVDWIDATFYKWRGYCAFISLSNIPGLTL